MLIIGHRGAAELADENTIRSLKKAELAGADMAEFDLRQTSDGEIVVIHDATLLRTHNDRRKVGQLTLAEVKSLGRKENRDIPTLNELLAAATIPLNLEVKEKGFEAKLIQRLHKFSGKVLISSPYPEVLKKIRTLDENIPLGLVIGPKTGYFFQRALKRCAGIQLYSVHPYHILITARNMRHMRKLNVKVLPWTVNDPEQWEILKEFGVDGVFTDNPNLINA